MQELITKTVIIYYTLLTNIVIYRSSDRIDIIHWRPAFEYLSMNIQHLMSSMLCLFKSKNSSCD